MRFITIDIMKGICMLLVVIAHTNFPGAEFINLFHMPVFFMISGYLFKNESYSDFPSLKLLIRRKICRLWFPYVTINLLFLCFEFMVPQMQQFSLINKGYLSRGAKTLIFCSETNSLSGPSWFLGTLFAVTILFTLINFAIKYVGLKYTCVIQALFATSFLVFSFLCQRFHLGIKLVFLRALTAYVFFYLGNMYRYHINLKQKHALPMGVIGIFILLFTFITTGYSVNIAANLYPSPFIVIVLALSGWHFIYLIAQFLEKNKMCSRLFSFIGVHTMSILLMHLTIMSAIENFFPNSNWCIRTAAGISLPLLFSTIRRPQSQRR